MSKQVAFFVTATNKTTKEKVDVGAAFEGQYGYSIMLKPGTVIKVTHAYNKETKQSEALPTPVYIEADSHFINLNENKLRTDKGDSVEAQIRSSFQVDKGNVRKGNFGDLPF